MPNKTFFKEKYIHYNTDKELSKFVPETIAFKKNSLRWEIAVIYQHYYIFILCNPEKHKWDWNYIWCNYYKLLLELTKEINNTTSLDLYNALIFFSKTSFSFSILL